VTRYTAAVSKIFTRLGTVSPESPRSIALPLLPKTWDTRINCRNDTKPLDQILNALAVPPTSLPHVDPTRHGPEAMIGGHFFKPWLRSLAFFLRNATEDRFCTHPFCSYLGPISCHAGARIKCGPKVFAPRASDRKFKRTSVQLTAVLLILLSCLLRALRILILPCWY